MGLLAVSWFQNGFVVSGAVATLASGIAVVARAVRRERSPVLAIPWWWWFAQTAAFGLVAAGTSVWWVQGACVDAAFLCGGIGLAEVGSAVRAGRFRIGRQRQRASYYDHVGAQDWQAGTDLVRILEVTPLFFDVRANNPFVDFGIRLVSLNMHQAKLQSQVTGRIELPNAMNSFESLAHPPELHQFTQVAADGRSVSQPLGRDMSIQRNQEVIITMRQHLLPAVRDALLGKAGTSVPFRFDNVNVLVAFERPNPTGMGRLEPGLSSRLKLGTYQLEIPSGLGGE